MANVLQDYFNRVQALNRQRGMTGNMQYGRSLDPSIAEGYFDSYQKNKLQSQQLGMQREALELNKENTKWQQGFSEKQFSWESGFKEKELAAQIDYNLKMLGFKGEELALAREYQLGMLGVAQQDQANKEWYNKESIGIQRDNAAVDRMYKSGLLANQAESTAAQRDAANKSMWVGLGTGLLGAGGQLLGYMASSRRNELQDKMFMAWAKKNGWLDENGNFTTQPAISPETATNSAYMNEIGDLGSLSYLDYNAPAFSSDYYTNYTGNYAPIDYSQYYTGGGYTGWQVPTYNVPTYDVGGWLNNIWPSVDTNYGFSYDQDYY